jgi:hypothetical protein
MTLAAWQRRFRARRAALPFLLFALLVTAGPAAVRTGSPDAHSQTHAQTHAVRS